MSAVPSSPLQLPKANCSSTWPLAGGKPFHDDSISHAGPIVCSEKCQGKKPFRVASEAGCSPDVREVGGKRASWGRRLFGGGAVSGTLAPVQAQFLAARPKPGFHSLSLRLHPTKHFSESVRCCSGPPRMQARQILSSLSGPLSPRESGASAGSASPGVRAEATAWPWLAYLSHPLGGPTGGGSA